MFCIVSTLKETLMLHVKDGVATFHSLCVFSASREQRDSRRVEEVPMRYSILHCTTLQGKDKGRVQRQKDSFDMWQRYV